ncbi:MAG: peptide deformylase [Acidimicrobiales bacterium]
MAPLNIRLIGDPVLRQRCPEVTEVDGSIARLAKEMIETLHDAPGIGLAAPQVGVLKRMFVYDIHDGSGPGVVINPVIAGATGEWVYEEGCLSIPGLYWEVTRAKQVHLTGLDLDGNDISIAADELLGRVFLHETDHVDGVLFIDRLDGRTRKQALRTIREIQLSGGFPPKVKPDKPEL